MKITGKYCFPIEKYLYDGVWNGIKNNITQKKQTINWNLTKHKHVDDIYCGDKLLMLPQKKMLPGDFKWPGLDTHAKRNFIITGEDIMRLYGTTHFVDRGPMNKTVVSQRRAIKLPIPVHIAGTSSCEAPEFNPPVGNYFFRNNSN